MERKLAAILAADVVGYSRLMEANEVDTHARLKGHRCELWTPEIEEHSGRIVGTAGDSILVEFASVVSAVECAVAVQQGMTERNAGLPDNLRMLLRVGINIGEVIVEADDIYGDGVNVAARMQEIAEPGGIAISSNVYEQVHGKLYHAFEDAGLHEVKNIARPIHVWRWREHTADGAGADTTSPEPLPLPDKPSIAVLPFDNMSGDPEQQYFADGIAEDIISSLSKLSQLFVIARNSSFTYRGRAVKVQEVAEELGVRYVVEGSVRKSRNRVRISVQLIDCATGGHIWVGRFDRELRDIFVVQDEVTEEIVSAMALKLTVDDEGRLKKRGTHNPEAYDCLLRGHYLFGLRSKDGILQARAMYERAIEVDPKFVPAWVSSAECRLMEYINRWHETADQPLEMACELAQRAVALDETSPEAHVALGNANLWKKQHDRAIAGLERAIVLDPNSSYAYVLLGCVLHYAGRSKEGIEQINLGLRLDPNYPDIHLHWLALAYFQLGRYEEAIAFLKRRLIRKPDTDISRVLLAACYGQLGRVGEAKVEWAEALRINPDYSLEHRRRVLPYRDPADFEKIVDGLRKAGLRE